MSDLATLVESLKRAVAVPGTFDTVYASDDSDLVGALADGFAQAQLDGFFTPSYGDVVHTLDPTAGTVTPDIDNAQGALVVIYAASQFIMTYLLNLKNRTRYAAKGTEAETEQSASILTELLKQMNARITVLKQRAVYSGYASAFAMADGYFLAATQRYAIAGDGYNNVYDPYGG